MFLFLTQERNPIAPMQDDNSDMSASQASVQTNQPSHGVVAITVDCSDLASAQRPQPPAPFPCSAFPDAVPSADMIRVLHPTSGAVEMQPLSAEETARYLSPRRYIDAGPLVWGNSAVDLAGRPFSSAKFYDAEFEPSVDLRSYVFASSPRPISPHLAPVMPMP